MNVRGQLLFEKGGVRKSREDSNFVYLGEWGGLDQRVTIKGRGSARMGHNENFYPDI